MATAVGAMTEAHRAAEVAVLAEHIADLDQAKRADGDDLWDDISGAGVEVVLDG